MIQTEIDAAVGLNGTRANRRWLSVTIVSALIFALVVILVTLPKFERHAVPVDSGYAEWHDLRQRGRRAERNGQFDEAIQFHLGALRSAVKTKDDSNRAESLRDLAEIHYRSKNVSEAITSFEQCLDAYRKTKNPNLQMMDPVLDKLAELYTLSGKHSQAERYLKQLLEMRKPVLPLDGTEVMPIYARYISCLEFQNKREESLAVCHEILSAGGKEFATNRTLVKRIHEATLALGKHHHDVQIIELALPVYALASKNLTDANSRPVYVVLDVLSTSLIRTGKSAEVEQLLRDDIEWRTKHFPADVEWIVKEREALAKIRSGK